MKTRISYALMILGAFMVLSGLLINVIVRMWAMKDLTGAQYFWAFGWKPMIAMFIGLIPILIAYHKEGLLK